jgi:hypothetical protein
VTRPSPLSIALLFLLALPLAAQTPAPPPPVPTQGLAGQQVALVPLTLVAMDPVYQSDTLFDPYRDRRTTLSWADSLIGEAFVGRAPEVKWVLPPALRKIARRAPGIVDDPDLMGQALLRSPKVKDVPDPLRASLRNLMAVVGGRFAMVPASLAFTPAPDGRVRAEFAFAAADVRSGRVVWRSQPVGDGVTPAAALTAALDAVLPVDP